MKEHDIDDLLKSSNEGNPYGTGIKRGGWAHQKPGGGETNVWLTPQKVLDALGPFDLDPCACVDHPTRCAPRYFTEADDGLSREWSGLVFCNPPYGKFVGPWLQKCAEHGNAIALVAARTETAAMNPILKTADLVLFPLGRYYYLRPDLTQAGNGGSPPMFLAWGELAVQRLRNSHIPGSYMVSCGAWTPPERYIPCDLCLPSDPCKEHL